MTFILLVLKNVVQSEQNWFIFWSDRHDLALSSLNTYIYVKFYGS